MAAEDDEATPPGWYKQADDPTLLRWWDGDDWTDDTMPVPGGGRLRSRPAADGADEAGAARSGPRRTRAQAMAELEAEARGEGEVPSEDATAEVPVVAVEAAPPRSPRRPRGDRPARITAPPTDPDVDPLPASDGPPAVEILVQPTSDSGPAEAARPPRRAPRRVLEGDGEDGGGPAAGYRRPGSETVRVLGDDGWPEPERRSLQADDAEWASSAWPGDQRDRARGPRSGAVGPAGDRGRPGPGPGPGPRRPRGADERRPDAVSRGTVERSGRGARTKEEPPSPTPQIGKVLVRALAIAALVGLGYLGYVRLRDAAPEDATTLTDEPAAVTIDPDAPRLDQIVLTLADLPRGWSVQAADPSDDDICDGRVPRSVIEPSSLQSAYFSFGDTGSLIGNVVHEFANEMTARSFMDLTAEVVESCREYAEGDTASISLRPFEFPRFGDETFVAQVTGSAPGGESHGAIVYVRVGNRVASLATVTFGETEVNKELIEHLTQLLEHRMRTKPELGALPEG